MPDPSVASVYARGGRYRKMVERAVMAHEAGTLTTEERKAVARESERLQEALDYIMWRLPGEKMKEWKAAGRPTQVRTQTTDLLPDE